MHSDSHDGVTRNIEATGRAPERPSAGSFGKRVWSVIRRHVVRLLHAKNRKVSGAIAAVLVFGGINAMGRTNGWAASPFGAGSPVVSTQIPYEQQPGAVGDFDGNGITDVVDFRGPTVAVSLGSASGVFATVSNPLPAFTTFPTNRAVVADFDSDGRLDLIGGLRICTTPGPFGCGFGSTSDSGIGWMRGLGGGAFAAPAFLLVTTGQEAGMNLLAGDFTGDAAPDLALWPMFLGTDALGARYGVSFLPNVGGALGARVDVLAGIGAGPQSVKVARADADGRDDLYVFWNEYDLSNNLKRYVGTVLGGATPTLAGAQEVIGSPYGWDDSWITTGDVNGDLRDDLLAMDYNLALNCVCYFLRLSGPDGVLGSPTAFVPEPGINERAVPSIGDVTGDGLADLVYLAQVPNLWLFDVSVAPGNGDGTFGTAFGLTRRLYGQAVRLRDFDGDGDRDVHVVHSDPMLGTWYRTIIRNPVSVGDGLDRNAPFASIISPQQGRTYDSGEVVLADYACADEYSGGSGLASCAGPVAPATTIDTSTPGTFTFSVVARDVAGNESTTAVTYTVAPAVTTTTIPDTTTTTIPDTTTTTVVPTTTAVPVPLVSVADVTSAEGISGLVPVAFTVSLSQPSAGNIRVAYQTADGTATAPDDYRARTGSVLIPAGSTSATISVNVVGDTTVEPDETFGVTLTGVTAGNATLADPLATATIVNDDVNVEASVADVTVNEGVSGLLPAAITVTLSAPAPAAVRLSYSTGDGSAIAPVDYRTRTGTLLIPAGATTATINVNVVGDTTLEPDEIFNVELTGVASGPAVIVDSSATVTIANDDVNVGASIADIAVTEGNSGFTPAVFTVTLTGPAPSTVRIAYTTVDGTAVAPGDYRTRTGTLVIAAGASSGVISINTVGNTVAEPEEQFSVTLTGVTSGPAELVDASAVAVITDND